MKKPKSTTLRNLLLNFRLAQFSNKNSEIDINKIIEFKNADLFSRRKFVGDFAKLGLLTGLMGPTALIGCNENKSTREAAAAINVAIIGAGMGGLNAAWHLKKAGIKATVYEGSNRLGGRILTHYGDVLKMGIHPEFGADFIDSNHADMLALANEFELELIDMYSESSAANLRHETFFFDGRHISEEEIIIEFKKIAPQLIKDAESLGEDYDTPEALLLDKLPLSNYINSLKCKKWLKDILTTAYIAEFGLETSEQSTINMLDMIETDTAEGFKVFGDSDEKYRIKKGNSALIALMAAQLEGSIEMKSMLTGISDKNGKYILSFNEKEEVQADFVIIAIPFTTLRNVQLNLKDITEDKKNAIQNLGYGQNNKLFLGYENMPWREGGNKFYGYLFHKDIHDGWDASTIKSVENTKGVYCCFFGGNESLRLSQVAVKNPDAPPSHDWKTGLPQKEINKYVNELDLVFPQSKNTFAEKHVFASWSTNPFINASYTCPKPGQWNTEMLHTSTPIGDVYFAGEHCSIDFQGFMNGAAETGRVAAEQIIEKINLTSKSVEEKREGFEKRQ